MSAAMGERDFWMSARRVVTSFWIEGLGSWFMALDLCLKEGLVREGLRYVPGYFFFCLHTDEERIF